jgi:CelD/BcsL family acetyltransferase involved in cellulose biosynthesis
LTYLIAERTVFSMAGLIREHREDFDSISEGWNLLLNGETSSHIFSTYLWSRIWWHHLGTGELHLLAIYRERGLVGIAPLVRQGESLALLGDKEVCDYLDIIVLPGEEEVVVRAVLEYAKQRGCDLDLYPLLTASPWVGLLGSLAQQSGYNVRTDLLDLSYLLDLPPSWEDYLNSLSRKQRHELRRKLRRLTRAGQVSFSLVKPTDGSIEDFLRLFGSRDDKAVFLTPAREAFLREVAMELGDRGWLKLFFLELEGKRIATTLCFDYRGVLSLYNSGFDPLYADLSVGLIAKAWSIREAIQMGRKRFDFLRGAENYKAHLGGQPLEVYRHVLSSTVDGNETTGGKE